MWWDIRKFEEVNAPRVVISWWSGASQQYCKTAARNMSYQRSLHAVTCRPVIQWTAHLASLLSMRAECSYTLCLRTLVCSWDLVRTESWISGRKRVRNAGFTFLECAIFQRTPSSRPYSACLQRWMSCWRYNTPKVNFRITDEKWLVERPVPRLAKRFSSSRMWTIQNIYKFETS